MKILIVKTSALGDIIHAFPTIAYLRHKFPHAQIDWAVEKPFAELVKAHPYVDNVFCIESKQWRRSFFSKQTWRNFFNFRKQIRQYDYDVIFDLQGNTKSSSITLQARSKSKIGFGWSSVHEWPNLLVTNKRFSPPLGKNARDECLYLAQRYFQDEATFYDPGVALNISQEERNKIETIVSPIKKPKIMVCPGANWQNKQVPGPVLKAFLEKIDNAHFLFLWGTMQEKEVASDLQRHFSDRSLVVDKLSLPTLQNLMNRMDLIIAMDSLPLHLAGTTSAPTFSIFGASSANKYRPQGPQHKSYQGACPYGRTFERRCPILRTCKTGACIRNINPNFLFQAFEDSKNI